MNSSHIEAFPFLLQIFAESSRKPAAPAELQDFCWAWCIMTFVCIVCLSARATPDLQGALVTAPVLQTRGAVLAWMGPESPVGTGEAGDGPSSPTILRTAWSKNGPVCVSIILHARSEYATSVGLRWRQTTRSRRRKECEMERRDNTWPRCFRPVRLTFRSRDLPIIGGRGTSSEAWVTHVCWDAAPVFPEDWVVSFWIIPPINV